MDVICAHIPSLQESSASMQEREPLVAATHNGDALPAARKDNTALGMLWYAISSFFFAGMGACSKALGHEGFPVWEITLVRAVIIMAICLWLLYRDGAILKLLWCHDSTLAAVFRIWVS